MGQCSKSSVSVMSYVASLISSVIQMQVDESYCVCVCSDLVSCVRGKRLTADSEQHVS